MVSALQYVYFVAIANGATLQDRIPFILVLVDGNRLPISQHLIAQGSLGGYIAAHQFRIIVEDSLHQYGVDLSRFATTRIILFADLDKLARVYPQGQLPIGEFFFGFDSTHFETSFQEIDQTFVSRKNLEGRHPKRKSCLVVSAYMPIVTQRFRRELSTVPLASTLSSSDVAGRYSRHLEIV